MESPPSNVWALPEHAIAYLNRADAVPHRAEGEAVLLQFLPPRVARVLDLGSGGGRLLDLVKLSHPEAHSIALDFSPAMLDRLREKYAGDRSVTVVAHDLEEPLPPLGSFDAVVSSFAIHHLPHQRKRALYAEIFGLLESRGRFCNLEHVASPTVELHRRFLTAISTTPEQEDPSNKLLSMETQLAWLREIGFEDVDCHWKWLELALLAGCKPA